VPSFAIDHERLWGLLPSDGQTGENPIGEGVPIRPYRTSPEPKRVVVNYVAPEAVPCVFLAEPTLQRHITPNATEEIKLDGYRAVAVKPETGVTLFSRRRESLNGQFPYIVEALAGLPAGTVIDGELVALDASGRPDFNLLQNFRAAASRIYYYVFDLLCWKYRDLTRAPLVERRALLKSLVLVPDKRIRISDYVEAAAKDLLSAVREQGLEGVIGKRNDRATCMELSLLASIAGRASQGSTGFCDDRSPRVENRRPCPTTL
jgi:hypothetical protein